MLNSSFAFQKKKITNKIFTDIAVSLEKKSIYPLILQVTLRMYTAQ